MSILWCGGEEIDFPNGVVDSYQLSSMHRTSYSRTALGGGSFFWSDPFQSGEQTNVWLSFWFFNQGTANHYLMGIVSDDGHTGYWIYKYGYQIRIRRYILGTGWSGDLVSESGSSIQFSTLHKIDMRIINYGASGSIKVYEGGGSSPIIDYSADLSIAGVTGFNRIGGLGYTVTQGGVVSEVIAADEDTRLMSLKTLVPNASGDNNDWTGDYGSIDEVLYSDADFIYTTDVDQEFQCNLTGMPTGDLQVKGVKSAVRVTDLLATRGIQLGIKTNSVVHLGSTVNLDGSFKTVEQLYNNNPETSSQFTPSEIDALQLAVESKTAV